MYCEHCKKKLVIPTSYDRICSTCGEVKHVSAFSPRGQKCTECIKQYRKEWYLAHHEEQKVYHNKYNRVHGLVKA